MAKSYFAILGVPSGASPDEIKSAYRRLVKEYHPDRFPGGTEAFLQIQEAYSVLGDVSRRRQYEQSLHEPPAPVRGTRRSYRGLPARPSAPRGGGETKVPPRGRQESALPGALVTGGNRPPFFHPPVPTAAPRWRNRSFPCRHPSERAGAAGTGALHPDPSMDCPTRTANGPPGAP